MKRFFILPLFLFQGCLYVLEEARTLPEGRLLISGNATKLNYLSINKDEGAFYSKRNIITLVSLRYGLPGRKEVTFRLLPYGMEAGLKQTFWHNTRFWLSAKPALLYAPLFFHTPFAVSLFLSGELYGKNQGVYLSGGMRYGVGSNSNIFTETAGLGFYMKGKHALIRGEIGYAEERVTEYSHSAEATFWYTGISLGIFIPL